MPTYIGQYRASTVGQTGCIKEFATIEAENLQFPPQVNYFCDYCKIAHGFRFVRGLGVNTPNQRKRFDEYCVAHHIERDVNVFTSRKPKKAR